MLDTTVNEDIVTINEDVVTTNEESQNSKDNYGIVTTKNQLADVIQWLKIGHYVVLQSNLRSRVFFGKEDAENTFDKATIVVSCETVPGILDEGEWEWYINDAGFPESKVTNENTDEINKRLNDRPVMTFRS